MFFNDAEQGSEVVADSMDGGENAMSRTKSRTSTPETSCIRFNYKKTVLAELQEK